MNIKNRNRDYDFVLGVAMGVAGALALTWAIEANADESIGVAHTYGLDDCVEGDMGGSVGDPTFAYSYGGDKLDLSVSVPLADGSCGDDRSRTVGFSVERRFGGEHFYGLVDASTGGADAFGVVSSDVLGVGVGASVGPVAVEVALDVFKLTGIDGVLSNHYADDGHPFLGDASAYAEASLSGPWGSSIGVGGKCGLEDTLDAGDCKMTGSVGWSKTLASGVTFGASADIVKYPDRTLAGEGMPFAGETATSVTAGLSYRIR